MEWSKFFHAAVSVLHWLTGWLVHPKKGGCCEMDKSDIIEQIKKDIEK